jgi:hypothetical protein
MTNRTEQEDVGTQVRKRFEWVGLEEVEEVVASVDGMPIGAVKPIACAFMISAPKPSELLGCIREWRSAGKKLQQWLGKCGGPDINDMLRAIEDRLEPKMQVGDLCVGRRGEGSDGIAKELKGMSGKSFRVSLGLPGSDLENFEIFSRLDLRPGSRRDGGEVATDRIQGHMTARRTLEAFAKISREVLVEHGCRRGPPSELRQERLGRRADVAPSAITILQALLKLLWPKPPQGKGVERDQRSLAEQAGSRKRWKGVSNSLVFFCGMFPEARVWIPRRRGGRGREQVVR